MKLDDINIKVDKYLYILIRDNFYRIESNEENVYRYCLYSSNIGIDSVCNDIRVEAKFIILPVNKLRRSNYSEYRCACEPTQENFNKFSNYIDIGIKNGIL